MRLSPIVLVACLLCACQSTTHKTPSATLTLPIEKYDATMNAAAKVLRDRGFSVERFDARLGVVSALPLGIPTSLEMWHGNNPNLDDWEPEANLQDLRHRVRFTLVPKESSGAIFYFELKAEAAVERLDTPTKRVSAAFSNPSQNLTDIPVQWKSRGVENDYWQRIGGDEELENALVRSVRRELEN